MAVACPSVLSIRIVGSVEARGKRAEAFSLGPCLLLGISLRSLESANPVWCTQSARTIPRRPEPRKAYPDCEPLNNSRGDRRAHPVRRSRQHTEQRRERYG